jgi:hypothetical protein
MVNDSTNRVHGIKPPKRLKPPLSFLVGEPQLHKDRRSQIWTSLDLASVVLHLARPELYAF